MNDHSRNETEYNKISYAIVDVAQLGVDNALKQIATTLDAQLDEQNHENAPFIAFDGYQNVFYSKRLFLCGQSGSGKSRILFEVIKSLINNHTRVFLLNPRNITTEVHGIESPADLIDLFTNKDIVIWDNFPAGLVRRDFSETNKVLDMICSSEASHMLMALHPKYLEIYKNITAKFPEITFCEITYSRGTFEQIIRIYGESIPNYEEIYRKYVVKDLSSVANILWKKEPIPLAIDHYFKELLKNKDRLSDGSTNAIIEAENPLAIVDYYESQFQVLNNMNDRQCDVDFLYTLKLCYELGLARNIKTIDHLQRQIFNTVPPRNPSQRLGSWIYLSGSNYAIHDTPGSAIQFTEDIKVKIMNVITENFFDLVSNDHNKHYTVGFFIGKNIQYLQEEMSHGDTLLSREIYDYMATKRFFAIGLGQGIGEIFPLLDENLQKQIMKNLYHEREFSKNLGYHIGLTFSYLNRTIQEKILSETKSDAYFANGLGVGIGEIILTVTYDLKEYILGNRHHNIQFAEGLGIGLGRSINSIDDKFSNALAIASMDSEIDRGLGDGCGQSFGLLHHSTQEKLFEIANSDNQFSRGLGIGLAHSLKHFERDLQGNIFNRIYADSELGKGFGFGLGYDFTFLDQELQDNAFQHCEKNNGFAIGFGMGITYSLKYVDEEKRKFILNKSEEISGFAYGLGIGYGWTLAFIRKDLDGDELKRIESNIQLSMGLGLGLGYSFMYLTEPFQKQILEYASKNPCINCGLGNGLGYSFHHLDRDLQGKILGRASEFHEFSEGLGVGLGYIFTHLDDSSQKQFLVYADKDDKFAEGLGNGLGMIFQYLKEHLKKWIFEIAEKNREFSRGLGEGLGSTFTYFSDSSQKQFLVYADKDDKFAEGLGKGLGWIFTYMQKNILEGAFSYAMNNRSFATGFGNGVGHIFKYLPDKSLNAISELAGDSKQFAIALGNSVGSNLQYLDDDLHKKVFDIAKCNDWFSQGLSSAFSMHFANFNEKLQRQLTALSSNMPQVNKVPVTSRVLEENIAKSVTRVGENHERITPVMNDGLPYHKEERNGDIQAFERKTQHLGIATEKVKTQPSIKTLHDRNHLSLFQPDQAVMDHKRKNITFAIDDSILKVMRESSKRKGTSINTMMHNILSRYIDCYRYAERDRSLILPNVFMSFLLENLPEEAVAGIYKSIIFEWIPSIMLESKITLNLQNWIKHACNRMMMFAGVIQSFSSHLDDEGHVNLVFLHKHGPKGSKIISRVLIEFIHEVLQNDASITLLPNGIIIKISEGIQQESNSNISRRLSVFP